MQIIKKSQTIIKKGGEGMEVCLVINRRKAQNESCRKTVEKFIEIDGRKKSPGKLPG